MDNITYLGKKDSLGFSSQDAIINGIPISGYNDVLENKTEDFYISYLPDDRDYGCITTALVKGQMQHFYILNGDHRKEYAELISKGFDSCLDYFRKNIELKNKYSECA